MFDRHIISWTIGGGRVLSFSTSGGNGKTKVKVELEFTDGHELADVIRQLQDASATLPQRRRPPAK